MTSSGTASARVAAPSRDAYDSVEAAAAVVRERFGARPDAAIILGTGLGELATQIDIAASIDYSEVPGFQASTAQSHVGRLICGTLAEKTVIAMQGRFHRYEGHSLQTVTFPVRVLRALGADTLIVSNASGGLNPLWAAGDVMLIADHINLLGDSPLIGANDERFGPRFPDMSSAYDWRLRALVGEVAAARGIALRDGVYVAVAGPNLETPAECRFLRAIGADAVGMSTVPEVLVAIHGGMRVLGLSIITNMCLSIQSEPSTVDEIIAVAVRAEPAVTTLIRGVLEAL